MKTFPHISQYYTSCFITKFKIKNSMNVLFDNRSSIRPFFPIHPSIYPQNLLKKFVSIGNGIRIISLDFFEKVYESDELISTERPVEHYKRNQPPMFARCLVSFFMSTRFSTCIKFLNYLRKTYTRFSTCIKFLKYLRKTYTRA